MTRRTATPFARPIDPVGTHVYVVPVVRELPLPQPAAGASKSW